MRPSTAAPEGPENPRAALVALLTEHLARAVAAGDLAAARIAHDAIGQLLGASDAGGQGAPSQRGKGAG